jgi:hypothetical protein
MVRYKWFSLIVLAVSLLSCGKELPNLDGIDKKSWAEDKNACLKKRTAMIETMRTEKEKLLALNEMKIVALLGKPDEHEIYKRNQKFFYYYLEPAPGCFPDTTRAVPLRLVIRFNATGLAKEVSVE